MIRFLNAFVLYPLAERYAGRSIRVKVRQLRKELKLPFAERKALRRQRLASLLEQAGGAVPYYRDLFRELRFDAAKIACDAKYLQELPYLTKDILREQDKRMLSERFEARQLRRNRTGGSTGPAAFVYYSPEAIDWTAAVSRLSTDWAGKASWRKEAHFCARLPDQKPPHLRAAIAEFGKLAALNRAKLFVDRFDPQGLEALRLDLRRAKPYLIQGHPSTLYALAVHIRDTGQSAGSSVRVIVTTGEVLDSKKRETIEAVFGCPVINRYGSAEFGIVAHQRRGDPRLHVFDAVVWPETRQHESGNTELVFTNLVNDAMPLVRYCTGDLGQLVETGHGYQLDRLVGRVHDLVQIGAARYPTHYVMDVLDRIAGIDEFQLEQTSAATLLIRVVAAEARHSAISQRVRKVWGDQATVEFTDFQGLQRSGWQSKFRHLVSPSETVATRTQAA